MSLLPGQWLWFFDNDLVQAMLNVQPDNPQVARRAATHPSVVRAVRLWVEGARDSAIDELEAIGQEDNTDALILLGQMHFEQGRMAQAEDYFARLAGLCPDQPAAAFNHGLCLARQGKWQAAIEVLQRTVILAPDRPEAWFTLGVCLLHERRGAEALSSFSHSLKLEDDYAPAWAGKAAALQLLGRHNDALVVYERLLAEQPRRQELLENALLAAIEAPDGAKARRLAGRLLQLNPESPAALLALARMALEEEDFQEAAQWCERLANASPSAPDHWYNLGVCYHLLGQPEKAAEAFSSAVALWPDDRGCWEGLAHAYMDLGLPEKAIDAWRSLLALAPERVDCRFRLALLQYDRGDRIAALASFQECVAHQPEWIEARLNCAALHWDLGDRQAARQTYESALTLDPSNRAALRALAQMAIEDQAGDAAERYVSLLREPDWELTRRLATFWQQQGNLQRAAELYQQALEIRPGSASELLNLGTVLFGLGKLDRAQHYWKSAVALDPGMGLQLAAWVSQNEGASRPQPAGAAGIPRAE